MREVSQKFFDKKTRDGDWESVTDVNSFGTVEVRDTRNGSRFTVRVRS